MVAVSMLTRIPVSPRDGGKNASWTLVPAFFPICGWILGAAAALPALLPVVAATASDAVSTTDAFLAAAIFVAALAWLSRAFHLDGFCDAIDAATAPATDKARRLEIMKDSNTGAAAAVAVAILVIVKTAAFAAVIAKTPLPHGGTLKGTVLTLAPALLAAPILARTAMLALAWMGEYPKNAGTGKSVVDGANAGALLLGVATAAPLVAILPAVPLLAAAAAAAISAVFWKLKSDSLVGGVNGDILGACCESAECAAAIAIALAF